MGYNVNPQPQPIAVDKQFAQLLMWPMYLTPAGRAVLVLHGHADAAVPAFRDHADAAVSACRGHAVSGRSGRARSGDNNEPGGSNEANAP